MNHQQHPLSGTSPPVPSSAADTKQVVGVAVVSHGQKLLSLLRSEELQEETIRILQDLIQITGRRGLLQGDEDVAEQVLANKSTTSSGTAAGAHNNRKNRGGKRGRNSHNKNINNNNNDLTMQEEEESKKGPAVDGQLVLSALQRILTTTTTKIDVLLVALGADLLAAISSAILARPTIDTVCTIAEYELMAGTGKQLLGGLETCACAIISERLPSFLSHGTWTNSVVDEEECCVYAVTACLRAASLLVTLFGTKLSRSTAVLTKLRLLAYKSLAIRLDNADHVVHLAAKLLATLPLAGGTNNVTPADLWNNSLDETLEYLSFALRTVAPLGTSQGQEQVSLKDSSSSSSRSAADVKKFVEQWIETMRQTNSDRVRGESFLQLVRGLVAVVTFLIARDDSFFGMGGPVALTSARVDCEAILHLVDTMISFPLASEASFHGTKKRLRFEAIEGGLISPATLAAKVANEIKLCGHGLLDGALLSNVGPAALFPLARRIFRIAHAALRTSSSAAVRRVVDPSSDLQFRGKRQRWLHNSVETRRAAVETFRRALLAFGCDPSSKSSRKTSSSSSSSCSADVERSLHLICGYVLEEMSLNKSQQPEEWGSLHERAELVVSSVDCLAASLTAGGEFLSLTVRELLDSTACLCLTSIAEARTLSSFGQVRSSFLAFATSCVGTPWQDGAASSIANELLEVAKLCRQDAEAAVKHAANSAIQLCAVSTFPRVPALTVVTRSSANSVTVPSAKVMQTELRSVQSEIDARRMEELQKQEEELAKKQRAASDAEKSKQDAKRARIEKNEKETKEVGMAEKDTESKAQDSMPDSAVPDRPATVLIADTEKAIEKADTKNDVIPSNDPVKLPERVEDDESKGDESEDDFPMIVDDGGPDDDDM